MSARVVKVCDDELAKYRDKAVDYCERVFTQQDETTAWYCHELSSVWQFVKAQKNERNDTSDKIEKFCKL